MAHAEKARRGGFGSRLRRLLGTEHLRRQVKLLESQNESLKRQSKHMARLADAAERQAKLSGAIRDLLLKQIDQTKSFRAELLSLQKELATLEKQGLTVQNHSRSRLDQVSHSLFELNRTLHALYKQDDFDLGSRGDGFFSQNGEDGIIGEIARRLGLEAMTFIEIGAGDGAENNSIQLLLGGGRGTWIEADSSSVASIKDLYAKPLEEGRLKVIEACVTAENVDTLLGDANVAGEVDFFSLDIDGNDYWVWQAVTAVSPRIVCLEYNAFYGPNISWVKAYQQDFMWPGKNIYYGASLKAMEKLSRKKGYTLVACDYSGVNAFFVRDDLLNDAFTGPFTAERFFEPFRGAIGRRLPTKSLALGPHENV